ncbi:MAG TPA: DegV family protein [Anaerolineales bacterium]|nr:DegV family protein [Anaerolineales bacterium]HNE03172.1 DegV family protein [Anaerolineales bacterium]HNF93053.1 DegV family protein [Anaerolineales bacterium]HNO92526.1 DegV family protein [Anaerolineales bacterium]
MLRIVTDGAVDLPTEWYKEYDIHRIPINVHFGEEKTFIQDVELDQDGFYKLVDGKTLPHPKTSQPSPHQFAEFYKKIAQPGDTILSIHITSKLSGTYASSVAAAEELKGTYTVVPVDTLCGTMGTAFMCRSARQMERAGKSVDEIKTFIEGVRSKTHVILTLETLEYAKRSGRVGTLSAALASVLNVKPIAMLKDGIVDMVDRVRTRKGAIDRVLDLAKENVGDSPVHIGVVHARDEASAKSLLEEAQKRFNVKESFLTDLSISLVINFGPGTVGLVLYPAE